MTELIGSLLEARAGEKFDLHEQHLNGQLVRVLRTIGFDRHYKRGAGAYLYDEADQQYLDLLSGFGTFALGRNHPTVNAALREVLDSELPNLAQLDVSALAGLLAEALIKTWPGDSRVKAFFANSGTEAVEGGLKLARYATGRDKVVCLKGGYHGLTLGSLSVTSDEMFQKGFGALLPGVAMVKMNDLDALDQALRGKDVAAFIVEPIQGKGVHIPDDNYLAEAARLCSKYGTVFIADEVQTGLGRTGKMWAMEHWGVEPDMLLTAKALSGGHAPVGAILAKAPIMDAVFDRMDRAVVHGSTFGKNDMAMAAGLATLRVLEEEKLIENAARIGGQIIDEMRPFIDQYEFMKDVRGKGLMIAVEFGPPKSLKLKASWKMLETANKSLFSQMILIPLFEKHRILAQVAGAGMHVIKLLPPLVINESDKDWIIRAFDEVVADTHKVPGAIWSLGASLAKHAVAPSKKQRPPSFAAE
ncbi:MAG: aspartate aminotransferase family protein [Pseudomonadota bacterium]